MSLDITDLVYRIGEIFRKKNQPEWLRRQIYVVYLIRFDYCADGEKVTATVDPTFTNAHSVLRRTPMNHETLPQNDEGLLATTTAPSAEFIHAISEFFDT